MLQILAWTLPQVRPQLSLAVHTLFNNTATAWHWQVRGRRGAEGRLQWMAVSMRGLLCGAGNRRPCGGRFHVPSVLVLPVSASAESAHGVGVLISVPEWTRHLSVNMSSKPAYKVGKEFFRAFHSATDDRITSMPSTWATLRVDCNLTTTSAVYYFCS